VGLGLAYSIWRRCLIPLKGGRNAAFLEHINSTLTPLFCITHTAQFPCTANPLLLSFFVKSVIIYTGMKGGDIYLYTFISIH